MARDTIAHPDLSLSVCLSVSLLDVESWPAVEVDGGPRRSQ